MKNVRIKIPCKPAFGHPAAHASHLGARLGVMGIVVVPAPGSENEAVATGVAMVIAPGGGH